MKPVWRGRYSGRSWVPIPAGETNFSLP